MQQLELSALFGEELVHERLTEVEGCALDAVIGIVEVEKFMLGRHGKNAERSRYPKPFTQGNEHRGSIIDQQHIGVEFDRQCDHVFFASVELVHGRIVDMNSFAYFYPSWGSCDPVLNGKRGLVV